MSITVSCGDCGDEAEYTYCQRCLNKYADKVQEDSCDNCERGDCDSCDRVDAGGDSDYGYCPDCNSEEERDAYKDWAEYLADKLEAAGIPFESFAAFQEKPIREEEPHGKAEDPDLAKAEEVLGRFKQETT